MSVLGLEAAPNAGEDAGEERSCSCSARLLLACSSNDESPNQGAPVDPAEQFPGGATTNALLLGVNAFTKPASNITEEHEGLFYSGNSFFNQSWVQAPSSTRAARRPRAALQRALVLGLPLQGRARQSSARRRRRLRRAALATQRPRRGRARRGGAGAELRRTAATLRDRGRDARGVAPGRPTRPSPDATRTGKATSYSPPPTLSKICAMAPSRRAP